MKKACFPGSFDPFTKGHEDIVRRGLSVFDRVVIAIGYNSTKSNSLFSIESRLAHIRSIFAGEPNIEIETYSELTVDFCKRTGCTHILRGLRDVKDFNYEQSIALMNRTISEMETVFLLPDPALLAINSSIVREIWKNGGKIDAFVTNTEQLVKTA